jgi:hypothetical protein
LKWFDSKIENKERIALKNIGEGIVRNCWFLDGAIGEKGYSRMTPMVHLHWVDAVADTSIYWSPKVE